MLDQIASEAAARVISHLLRHDVGAQARLAPFAGRRARIEIAGIRLAIAVGEAGARIEAAPGAERPDDVRIVVAPRSLMSALTEPSAVLRNLRVDGDAEFAAALAAVLQRLRLDPEEELAPWVGDIAAVRVAAMLRSIGTALRDVAQQGAHSAADFLAGERPVLATRAVREEIAAEAQALAQRTEALATRIDTIERCRR